LQFVAGFAFKKSKERQKKNITLKRQMMSKMVYHVSAKEDANHLSMLMMILPTKITTTITTTPKMVRKTKRMDLNLLLKASKLSVGELVGKFSRREVTAVAEVDHDGCTVSISNNTNVYLGSTVVSGVVKKERFRIINLTAKKEFKGWFGR
jgi:hypothetical protein